MDYCGKGLAANIHMRHFYVIHCLLFGVLLQSVFQVTEKTLVDCFQGRLLLRKCAPPCKKSVKDASSFCRAGQQAVSARLLSQIEF